MMMLIHPWQENSKTNHTKKECPWGVERPRWVVGYNVSHCCASSQSSLDTSILLHWREISIVEHQRNLHIYKPEHSRHGPRHRACCVFCVLVILATGPCMLPPWDRLSSPWGISSWNSLYMNQSQAELSYNRYLLHLYRRCGWELGGTIIQNMLWRCLHVLKKSRLVKQNDLPARGRVAGDLVMRV